MVTNNEYEGKANFLNIFTNLGQNEDFFTNKF